MVVPCPSRRCRSNRPCRRCQAQNPRRRHRRTGRPRGRPRKLPPPVRRPHRRTGRPRGRPRNPPSLVPPRPVGRPRIHPIRIRPIHVLRFNQPPSPPRETGFDSSVWNVPPPGNGHQYPGVSAGFSSFNSFGSQNRPQNFSFGSQNPPQRPPDNPPVAVIPGLPNSVAAIFRSSVCAVCLDAEPCVVLNPCSKFEVTFA